MRYISDDGKIFDTDYECLEYENNEKRRLEEEKILREIEEKKRKDRLFEINKKYQELEKLISDFGEDYGVKQEIHFLPIYELIESLCG